MPGMNSATSTAYGLLADSLFIAIGLTALIGIAVAVIVVYVLPSLGVWDLPRAIRRRYRAITDEYRYRDSERSRFLRKSFAALWLLDGLFQMRPDMPGGFIQQVVEPSVTIAPRWVIAIQQPFLNAWADHPVHLDNVAAWIQIFIGISLLVLPVGRIMRYCLWLSLLWSLPIVVVGNGFGLFYEGAGWTTGAPSAIYIYVFVSIYLLALQYRKLDSTNPRPVIYFASAFLLAGALLQALPGLGHWTAHSMGAMATLMSHAKQPIFVSVPLAEFASLASSNNFAFNVLATILPLTCAVFLVGTRGGKWSIYLTIASEFLAWWFGMDFGIFSSTATDVNSGLPLILLVASLLKSPQTLTEQIPHAATVLRVDLNPATAAKGTKLRQATFAASGVSLVGSLMLWAVSYSFGPSSSQATAISGGIEPATIRPIPRFQLSKFDVTHNHNPPIPSEPTLLVLTGKNCGSNCRSMLYKLIALTARGEADSNKVAVMEANPTSPASNSELKKLALQLTGLTNWYLIELDSTRFQQLASRYSAEKDTRNLQQTLFFLRANGDLAATLNWSGFSMASASYQKLIRTEIQKLS